MTNNNGNGTTRIEMTAGESLVAAVEANVRTLVEATEHGMAAADTATHSSTVAVMRHLESVAEQAVLAQCAEIRRLVTEAQDLDALLLTDLARVKEVARICLLNGERAAALAGSIRSAIAEMRSEHAVSLQPT